MGSEKEKVCVTGAGGFTASWIVKLLLSKDFVVHGTVRQPDHSKNDHLKKLEKASDNLKLFQADLLDYDSLRLAVEGCTGFFHVASPVPASTTVTDPETELLEPAVKGTRNVLKACLEAKVKRVVVVSSIAAVVLNPNWPKDQVMDEACWSDPEYVKKIEQWYSLSKTIAESEALEFGKTSGVEVVTICPSLILGPMLQPTLNLSSRLLLATVNGRVESIGINYWTLVDVRDFAEAVLLAYEKSEAGERYVCISHEISAQDVVEKYLRPLYPNYNYPKNLSHKEQEVVHLSSLKLQRLGWTYRPLEETLVDSIQSYLKVGLMD